MVPLVMLLILYMVSYYELVYIHSIRAVYIRAGYVINIKEYKYTLLFFSTYPERIEKRQDPLANYRSLLKFSCRDYVRIHSKLKHVRYTVVQNHVLSWLLMPTILLISPQTESTDLYRPFVPWRTHQSDHFVKFTDKMDHIFHVYSPMRWHTHTYLT